jgi:flagellar hook protein FlgE
MGIGTFSAGLSGLNAHAAYLGVIGNNLANLNTVGFKASTVNFVDLVSQAGGAASANPAQIGLGVVTGAISPVFTQGAAELSGQPTHVALQGNGFFVIGGNNPGYTRDGSFGFDKNGRLVAADGSPVMGWTQLDASRNAVVTGGPLGEIVVPPGVLRPAVATTQFQTTTNLDASAATGATFLTSVRVYDALGAAHTVTVSYTKTGVQTWDYGISVDGADIAGGTPGVRVPLGSGSIAFDGTGALSAVTTGGGASGGGSLPGDGDFDVAFTTPGWASGAAASAITWDITGQTGVATLTGYGTASATASKTQNGSPAGTVDNVFVLSDGTVQAALGPDQSVLLGKIAVASFNNPQGLVKLGGNRFAESEASGLANIGEAGGGGRGTLLGGALELSTVDIAQEFTHMILAQRGYQANAKTITVSDEMAAETMNMLR